MEGIAGLIGGDDRGLVERMLKKLLHRGPGSKIIYSDDFATLGARCPKHYPGQALVMSKGIAVASDSYIFNKEWLRKTIAPGTDPAASDAELFLGMYLSIGPKMFKYVDGGYAVAIVHGNRTILARDPYGIKPLYISSSGTPTAYSSEMKSQVEDGAPFVPFSPGAILESGKGVKRIVPEVVPWANGPTPKLPEERVRMLMERSVRECLSGSRGVNVLLSGGIDSSIIASEASKVSKKVATACVGTEDSEDLKMARMVSEKLGTEHREKVFDKYDLMDMLDEAIYWAESYDYLLVRSCVPNLMAVRLFRDKERVTLVGEGCDELFAGYEFLRVVANEAKLRKMRVELLNQCHWTNFQRVDRITSSTALDGRMPVMSEDMVSFALGLKPKQLLGPRRANTKYVLRKAFEGILPDDIAWRKKRKFSDGAGSMNLMAQVAEKAISDRKFERRASIPGGARVRNKEEMFYFEAFRKHFPSESAAASVGITLRPS